MMMNHGSQQCIYVCELQFRHADWGEWNPNLISYAENATYRLLLLWYHYYSTTTTTECYYYYYYLIREAGQGMT